MLAADMAGDTGGGEVDGVVEEFYGTMIGWMFVMELQRMRFLSGFGGGNTIKASESNRKLQVKPRGELAAIIQFNSWSSHFVKFL
jgi:hypothetical protein